MQKVLMIVFSHYPADPRVRREAEALTARGYAVDVICLVDKNRVMREVCGGVQVFRVPLRRKRGGKLRYIFEYFVFILLAMLKTIRLCLSKVYRVVHVHNMPDVLIYCAWLPKLLGAKLVLDLHDPVPEVFIAKYGLARDSGIIKGLVKLEKMSIAFSDQVLTPNLAFKKVFTSRSCPPEKIEIVMNSPQETIFVPGEAPPEQKKPWPVLMFHGTVVKRHGLCEALYAIDELRKDFPDIRLKVFGDGDYVPGFLALRRELGLESCVYYGGKVSLEKISREIDTIDVGLIPNQRNVFTDINFPTRIFEYLIKEKPVVVPRTRGILDYFSEKELWFFSPGDAHSLGQTISSLLRGGADNVARLRLATAVYHKHTWEKEKRKLLAVYRELLTGESRR